MEFTVSDLSSNNPRQYWKIVKMLVKSNTNSCTTIPPLKKDDNSYAFSDNAKADLLNDYFTSISNIDDSNISLPTFVSKTDAVLNNVLITEQEITDILKCLITKKANGPDNISHTLLKATASSICKPLCLLFNRSIQDGTYPNSWKTAFVMPLFKKGDRDLTSNYRPISLISCVGKVFERLVFKNIYNHLHFNNLIYNKQSGFIPGHSTVYQLIDIYNQICKSFDEKLSTCIVFCDISKAFDRVWHKGLLFKLKQCGIHGILLRWIESYLDARNQNVIVGSSSSKLKCNKAGVPQGSVLGPLLFLIYVNDIADNLLSVTRLFADDSSLAVTAPDTDTIERILNNDLETISQWAEQWLVKFNPAKTEVLFLSFVNSNMPTLLFNNVQLNFVEHHKHLGLTFSQNGSWNEHISNIINSASKVLGSMRYLKFKLCRKTLNQIYVSFMRPILEYASVVWDGCNLYEKQNLEKLQYEAARVVTGLTKSCSIERLLREIGWVSLADRRLVQKLTIVYKCKTGNLPEYLINIFPNLVLDTQQYNLRNNDDFVTLSRRTEIYSKSFIPSSIREWNNLATPVRESPSLSIFKERLKAIFKPYIVPNYFLKGERTFVIYHTRIRNYCSNLNGDLFTNHLRDTPDCECGYHVENADHFFFNCPRFYTQRLNLFNATRQFHPLNTNTLLFGLENLTSEENQFIFTEVQRFIKATERF